jgi:hypothetical protein
MKAYQAFKLTEQVRAGLHIEDYLAAIYSNVEKATQHGFTKLIHPFEGLNRRPNPIQARSIISVLKDDGYEVEMSPPYFNPSFTISWNNATPPWSDRTPQGAPVNPTNL